MPASNPYHQRPIHLIALVGFAALLFSPRMALAANSADASSTPTSSVNAPDNPSSEASSSSSTDNSALLAEFGDSGTTATQESDPLYYWNIAMYHFNDRAYFWVMKPVATGYSKVVPEAGRRGVSNFFSNVKTPIRLVGCAMQAKFKSAGNELARFGINTTVGILGFGDPAWNKWEIEKKDEDLGQTLGVYKVPETAYLMLPILGPSTVRDAGGMVGDHFLDPVTYLEPWYVSSGVGAYDKTNELSLSLGRYEDLLKTAVDPYVAVRTGFLDKRRAQVKE